MTREKSDTVRADNGTPISETRRNSYYCIGMH